METIQFATIDVGRCTACHGLWFDGTSLERLLGTPGAEDIDDGDAAVGARYNTLPRANCPRCNVVMVRMTHPQQPHVWFERCGTCGGSWLDAGEFRDLAVYDWFDVVRGWFARPRR
jgi:Zn-finger nucleic acid-binding protein